MATGRYVHRFDVDEQHSVHIYEGSLVDVEADALVSSDDNYLSAGGGVSAALVRVAGDIFYHERVQLTQEGGLRLGDVARTSGGGLPCRYLYHAITIEDFRHFMDEATLRVLVANLLARATQDGIRTLGMPALGTGVAGFDIARASKIIIGELLDHFVDTPIRHIVLALIGDDAQRLFYEQLVRANAPRCAALSLRHFEKQLTGNLAETDLGTDVLGTAGSPEGGPSPAELARESGEQFPSLIDKTRLAAMPAGQPKLVAGLTGIVLKHADQTEIEQELLRRPECYGFRGTVEQRLMEFLYLGEKNLRMALGPALFKAKDLRQIAEELGEDCDLSLDPEQLIDLILRALGFNLLARPIGLTQHVARVEQLILNLESPDATAANRIATGLDAAKVLEQVLKDLLRLYGLYLFGPSFQKELVRNHVVQGEVTRLTLGQAHNALVKLQAAVLKAPHLHGRLARLGSHTLTFLPALLTLRHAEKAIDCGQVLVGFIHWRNKVIVHDDQSAPPAPDQRAVREQLENLRAFLLACRAEGIYPEVVRYEGTFENRDGERFVHFLDEHNAMRHARTDEKIDPRRHYYCFATNNPVHLFPVLVPKL